MTEITLGHADNRFKNYNSRVKWKVFRTVVDKERHGLQRNEDPHGHKKEAVKEATQ